MPLYTPIGIFDSGIGGTTVLRAIHALLPNEDLLYLADQAHVPYGPRPVAELQSLTMTNLSWLLEQGAKLLVIACNSASAAALTYVRDFLPHIPVVGMVPAVKPAIQTTHSRVVGVLATPATIHGRLLHEVIERYAGDVRVLTQACDGLAEAVEQGAFDAPETIALIERYVQPVVAAGADTLVLGCTHYPFLAPQIQRIVGPHVRLLDPAPAIAHQVERLLDRHALRQTRLVPGTLRYATTGSPVAFAALLERLGLPAGVVLGWNPELVQEQQ